MRILTIYRDCDACGRIEERVFTDSWTGKDLCLTCLHDIGVGQIAMTPSEGDNLPELLGDAGIIEDADVKRWEAVV